jgi:hypothetical protein
MLVVRWAVIAGIRVVAVAVVRTIGIRRVIRHRWPVIPWVVIAVLVIVVVIIFENVGDEEGLSGILWVRHNMREDHGYAKQEENRGRAGGSPWPVAGDAGRAD